MAGIYIHIPFCKQACYYCDFHFSTSTKKKADLIQALLRELRLRKIEFENQIIETIYFGGGTPSLLTINEIQLIISEVYQNYSVVDNPEITLEANPDDLDKQYIKDLANTDVNRLSVGIQSFHDYDLKLMNRAHNAKEAKFCLKYATEYFENLSIDLIYGIPGLTTNNWLKNIETALNFEIPHISSYALTVEPKTALDSFIKKGIVKNVDDALAQEQFYLLVEKLEINGFVNYELSNFGKPNYFSKNNSAYWLGKSYLGIGPSAHSFDGIKRSWNVKNNSKYIHSLNQNVLPLEIESLSKTDKYNEYVMTGLRTIWGVSLTKIEHEFGKIYKAYILQQANKYLTNEMLYIKDNIIFVTKKGKFLCDGIASDLFKINL